MERDDNNLGEKHEGGGVLEYGLDACWDSL